MEKRVEVISISRATDFLTGKDIYSIQFGNVYKRKEVPLTTTPPVISVTASIFVDFGNECPYKVGSKWIISVDETIGTISIRKE